MFESLVRFLCGCKNKAIAPEQMDPGIKAFVEAMDKSISMAEKNHLWHEQSDLDIEEDIRALRQEEKESNIVPLVGDEAVGE